MLAQVTHCNTRQHTATHCNTLRHTAPHCTALHHTAPHCITLCHPAAHCNALHHTAAHCTTLHHTAPLCTTLHHTQTHLRLPVQFIGYPLCVCVCVCVCMYPLLVPAATKCASLMTPPPPSTPPSSLPPFTVHTNTKTHKNTASTASAIHRVCALGASGNQMRFAVVFDATRTRASPALRRCQIHSHLSCD